MQRRGFLATIASLALTRAIGAHDTPQDLLIKRAIGFDLTSQRSKIAGRNAVKDVHGDRATDRMLRLETNTGLVAIGNCRADETAVGQLVGKNPFELYRRQERAFVGPLGAGTMPLWDLLGKATGKPAYELLGGAGPTKVPVYDGSIYFADLLPEHADRWQDRFRREIDMGLAIGHRAFKIKLGRGHKWMPRSEGDARDVAVVKLIRKHAGPDVLLGVDANNGYDLAGAKRLVDGIGDQDIAFAEELFPEVVEHCLELKQFIRDRGWKTLVADGETQGNLDVFKPFIAAKAIEVYQADMNRFGFEGILTEAAWAAEQQLLVAPHNWGSLVGYYMQLHVGRAIKNFYRAEHDPLSSRVLTAAGYDRRDGETTVPDAPGFGLSLNEEAFRKDVQVRFDLRSG
jgi:L-alanine-DL-glutamate epimerase-like enolase superfamily enzyme